MREIRELCKGMVLLFTAFGLLTILCLIAKVFELPIHEQANQ